MTEPAVASSDATNIETRIEPRRRRLRDQRPQVVVRRRVGDPRCKIVIVMGKTDPAAPTAHAQQSMILVPMDTPGVKIVRHLPVFGYDDAPHGHTEVLLRRTCACPSATSLLGEGRGFEIAQGRLGPGRIHHCMRTDRRGGTQRSRKMCHAPASRASPSASGSAEQSVWA
jgi:acyl-CoA dehydrogenase